MAEEPTGVPNDAGGTSKWRELLRNPISIIGLALALVALGNIVFLFFIDLTSDRPSPYVGILAYMVAPGFLIAGLVLVVVGVWLVRRTPGRRHGVQHVSAADPNARAQFASRARYV